MVEIFLAWKMIKGNIGKIFLPILGIIFSVAIMVGIVSISKGGKGAIQKELSLLGQETITVASRGTGEYRDIEYLESLEFVKYAVPREPVLRDIEKGMVIYGTTEKSRVEENFQRTLGVGDLLLEEGQESTSGQVKIRLHGRDYWLNLAGSLPKSSETGIFKGIIDLSTVKGDLELERGISVVLKYDDSETRELLLTALNQFNPRGNYYLMEDGTGGIAKRIKDNLGKLVAGVIGTATILGGLISALTAGGLIRNHRNQIGVLKAMGATDSDIFKIFFGESIILAVVGSTVGILIGVLLSSIVGKIIGISPIILLKDLIGIWFGTIASSGIFGTFPAKKAGSMRPAEAIKSR